MMNSFINCFDEQISKELIASGYDLLYSKNLAGQKMVWVFLNNGDRAAFAAKFADKEGEIVFTNRMNF